MELEFTLVGLGFINGIGVYPHGIGGFPHGI